MPGVLLPQETSEDQAAPSPMEVKEAAAEKEPEAPAARAVVGIIYPPPEVRNIVDKTADFVARNGPEFEDRIRLNEAGNTKFNFLNRHDPYHSYYQHKINEIKEGVAQEQLAAQQPGYIPPAKAIPVTMVLEPEVPKDPLPDYDFVVEPPSISAMELDIVKLTAQFVAKNGANFLDKLMMREQRNYQFDFLRKQHPLFVYFTKLVEQYSRVLLPPFNLTSNLRKEMEDPSILLDRSQQRMLWEQYQKKQQQKAEEEEEKKRLEYAQIDWHDFVIVETINFKENETGYLPPPIRPTQLAQRLLQQSKFERLTDEGEVQEIEMEVDDDQPDQGAATEEKEEEEALASKSTGTQPPASSKQPSNQPPVQAPKGPVQVRRDYNPKASQTGTGGGAAPGQDQFLISPITGEKIPAEKMQQHMRYGLLDPKWIEDSKKQVDSKKTQEEVLAEGAQITSNLKLLAERRTDIFGIEETIIGQKIGEEEMPKAPTVQWDGHAASAEAISREAQSNISEQLKVIQKAKEQAEKEQVGPTLKTPVNAAPPAHPPLSSAPPVSHPPSRPPEMPRPMHHQQPMSRPPGPPMGMQQRPLPRPPLMGRPEMPRPPMMGGPPGMMPNRPLIHPHPGPPGPPRGPPGMMVPPHMHPGMGGPPPHMQPPQFGGPPPPPHPAPPAMVPPPKRPYIESEDLIPEQEFVAKHPGPVGFKVLVPNMPDRPEWKLHGQMITITLPITDPVSVIKAKISDELGMPSGKQKLQLGQVFIKDSLSLGYYNVTPATVVQLGLKERGGRKK